MQSKGQKDDRESVWGLTIEVRGKGVVRVRIRERRSNMMMDRDQTDKTMQGERKENRMHFNGRRTKEEEKGNLEKKRKKDGRMRRLMDKKKKNV